MNILIIEDERPNAERLKRLILGIKPQANILIVLESVSESVEWLDSHEKPDLIMMDIKLSDGLSFEIFDKTQLVDIPIIFTTAYDEYAIKAFKQYSIDYLLKPVDKDELAMAFEKYDQLDIMVNKATNPSIEKLLDEFRPKNYRTRFLLSYRDGFKTVMVSDVLYFYSEQKITKARLADGTDEIIPHTMDELEQQLDPKLFFRANRQFIICINAVEHVYNYFNNKLKVTMRKNTDVEIIVSRDKAPLLKNWMGY
ncbi:LytR/AlgR family response regulator transcription factor [Elizabethkingia anophelis]|uniref:LytR/AlgR family response regulator transcription factor n=1 Tax=Elizabethkingia anophelis TaxID=1117645 RepID=UPI000999F4F6|nr:LytTR family DNA-binding domain-containing protein [Elizabethkingia anophelis]MCT3721792.1 response regulator transcription factor [Elizabethkingia anophelis]MCT3725385.1 response regulator transcription factor [Elizabethkingia anophelis]MCT3756862.1 response regulator transcription factor [Elizabethkingia anophelis]MCT3778474.1 response regulator transcription factor [Elizabethkingia anophelis]MCT3785629.1 response regulator transcription factor [Elizabethkingia anophelis]